MPSYKYIYTFGYDNTEEAISKLESKYIFSEEAKNRFLFSNKKIEPDNSAFIKRRVELIALSEDYVKLIGLIKEKQLTIDGFKVEYLVLAGDTITYEVRLQKLREIGYSIEGEPDYYNPSLTYALCYYDGIWYFGSMVKNNLDWRKHNQKPHSYSNSISISIAKALVNIAAKADKKQRLLDACCGAGTIMLEACYAGYDITGCDINWKLARDARKNLSHFDYQARVFRLDICDHHLSYNAAIIDLPYNLSTKATDNDILHIIKSTATLAACIVIVSISDLSEVLASVQLRIADTCTIPKKGKKTFARRVWVCYPIR